MNWSELVIRWLAEKQCIRRKVLCGVGVNIAVQPEPVGSGVIHLYDGTLCDFIDRGIYLGHGPQFKVDDGLAARHGGVYLINVVDNVEWAKQ